MMKNRMVGIAYSLVLVVLLNPILSALADDPQTPSQGDSPKTMEITLPDGTKATGFIKDGQFIRVDQAPIAGKVEQTVSDEKSSDLGSSYETQKINFNRIEDRYSGYKVIIQNLGPNPIKIINAEVTNGHSGQQVFQECKINTTGRALGYGVGLGILTLGVGALVGFGNAAHNSGRNHAAETAANPYDNSFTLGPLTPGTDISTMTFVPIGAKPQIRVTYEDEKTHKLLTYNH